MPMPVLFPMRERQKSSVLLNDLEVVGGLQPEPLPTGGLLSRNQLLKRQETL